SYCPADAVEPDDLKLPFEGFSAMVDADSKSFLEEAEIDFVTDQMGSQLTLKAPNAKLRKVADDAPLFERVHYFLQAEVNPQLAGHGGECTLIDITDDGYAILQFGGGCNGCSQIDVTVKDGIEKQLVEIMGDEIKGVKDVTEHERGDHSYY
nr:Fe-S biogenesis protein NfuA [Colwellia sp.]